MFELREITVGQRVRRRDATGEYRFDGWEDERLASPIDGRLARLTWMANGTRSASWESKLIPA